VNPNRAANAVHDIFAGELLLPSDSGYDQVHSPSTRWNSPCNKRGHLVQA
jgi:hypothetical protein